MSSLIQPDPGNFQGFSRDDVARGSTIKLKMYWHLAHIYCHEKLLWKFACHHCINLVIGVQIYCFDFVIFASTFVFAFHSVYWLWLSRHANGSEMIRFVALLAFCTIRWAISLQMLSSTEITFSDQFQVPIFVIFGTLISCFHCLNDAPILTTGIDTLIKIQVGNFQKILSKL